MGKIDDPKISKTIIRDPEPAGTPIERKTAGQRQARGSQDLSHGRFFEGRH